MALSDIPSGEIVVIDANIFLYHFTGQSLDCQRFFERCEEGDLYGFIGATTMSEVCHHLMIAEAISRKLITAQKPSRQLQEKPHVVQKLSRYYEQLQNISTWGIKILSTPEDLLARSQTYRGGFGLTTNDSFIPVYMQLAATTHLASADRIFASIPSLRLASPSDVRS